MGTYVYNIIFHHDNCKCFFFRRRRRRRRAPPQLRVSKYPYDYDNRGAVLLRAAARGGSPFYTIYVYKVGKEINVIKETARRQLENKFETTPPPPTVVILLRCFRIEMFTSFVPPTFHPFAQPRYHFFVYSFFLMRNFQGIKYCILLL